MSESILPVLAFAACVLLTLGLVGVIRWATAARARRLDAEYRAADLVTNARRAQRAAEHHAAGLAPDHTPSGSGDRSTRACAPSALVPIGHPSLGTAITHHPLTQTAFTSTSTADSHSENAVFRGGIGPGMHVAAGLAEDVQ